MIEQCWNIIESLPIPISVTNRETHYKITVSPMLMKYETFLKLNTTAVLSGSYDYENGEGAFLIKEKETLDKWLLSNANIIKSI